MLLAALTAAGLWWVVLAVLAWLTANPVTLNLAQIRQADYLVTARVDDPAAGTITIEKEWKHGAELPPGPIENLAATDVVAGESYLLPLTADGGRVFRITEARLSARRELNSGLPVPFRAMVTAGSGSVQSAADGSARDVSPGDRLNADDRVLSGRFQIIRLSPAYVYPATDEAMQQLGELLQSSGG